MDNTDRHLRLPYWCPHSGTTVRLSSADKGYVFFLNGFAYKRRWTFETGLTTVIYFRRMTSFCKSIGLLEGDFVFSFLQLGLPFTHFFFLGKIKAGLRRLATVFFWPRSVSFKIKILLRGQTTTTVMDSPLFYIMSIISKPSETLLDDWNYTTYTTCMRN